MAKSATYTICYEEGGEIWRLFKVIFGADGSYYVTAPYHPHNTALLSILRQTYTGRDGGVVERVLIGDTIEVATLENDEQRLKLAHHPDGFVQFSGEGITSGRDVDGRPKGIGLRTWSLKRPTLGPSFGVTFRNPKQCGRLASDVKANDLVIHAADLEPMRGITGFADVAFHGYYCPVPWRQFIKPDGSGGYKIGIVNPGSQAVLELPVIMASRESDYPGFIGVEATPVNAESTGAESGYFLSSSTGNLSRNAEGDLQGDALVCMYPKPNNSSINARNLACRLPAPPYKAPPGTSDIVPPLSPTDFVPPTVIEHLKQLLPPTDAGAQPGSTSRPRKKSKKRRRH